MENPILAEPESHKKNNSVLDSCDFCDGTSASHEDIQLLFYRKKKRGQLSSVTLRWTTAITTLITIEWCKFAALSGHKWHRSISLLICCLHLIYSFFANASLSKLNNFGGFSSNHMSKDPTDSTRLSTLFILPEKTSTYPIPFIWPYLLTYLPLYVRQHTNQCTHLQIHPSILTVTLDPPLLHYSAEQSLQNPSRRSCAKYLGCIYETVRSKIHVRAHRSRSREIWRSLSV